MTPIIVITLTGESFNYFQGRLRISEYFTEGFGLNKGYKTYLIQHELTGLVSIDVMSSYERYLEVFKTTDEELRNLVLATLHSEVRGCFSQDLELKQYYIQVEMENVIGLAKATLEEKTKTGGN